MSACELFLGKTEAEIKKVARETLEGHQRAILGQMTVEEIYQDRKAFSKHVFEVASSDLVNMGIYVVSYTIKDIQDEVMYLKSLGKARTAQVKRDARIGEAEAKRDSGIRESRAEEKRLEARYYNDTCIAQADRDYSLKIAAYDREIHTCKAMADLAYSLQAATTKQKVAEETMQIKVVEREMQISVEEHEITRKGKELQARVHVPADAERFRLETLADAEASRTIVGAQATADAIKLKGDAEAAVIEAKGQAEAEAMAKKADAWKDFQEAAKVDMVLEKLPQVAAEIANPLTNVKSLKMVSSGKGDVGVFKLTNEVISIMEKLPVIVESMTGLSVSRTMGVPASSSMHMKDTR
ncbi:hypothetical protein RRG08_049029 [Elysia crispata]|uniref:Band 7 domain-containing protein n=1 Tax=Elysia crispata TaxID=231223 RepID=A0AAE1DM14_9GAST|nr:hypothetical protein RRG08_049029 [Elysia crispata]